MGREVRKVPGNWEHPKNDKGNYQPQFSCSFEVAAKEWDDAAINWGKGLDQFGEPSDETKHYTYEDWTGKRPDPEDYMPQWSDEEATHYMMYEDTTEGTPISPAFDSPEKLARWLADTGASSFGRHTTATYEQWLKLCYGAFAPDMILKLTDDGSTLTCGLDNL